MQNDHLSFKKFSQGQIKGWLRTEIFNLLPSSFYADPVSFAEEVGGKVVKESRLRWAAIFSLPNQQRIFLKRDKTKGWAESLKYLFLLTKARKEWFVASQMKKRELEVPRPFGWMERVDRGFVKESYYLSEAVGSGMSLFEEGPQLRNGFPLLDLARFVKKMHEAGLYHKDLHAGNFLWDGQSAFLIDLHSTKIVKALSLKQKLWNLSHLFHSLRSAWGEEEHSKFIEIYFEGESFDALKKEKVLQRIHSWMDRLQKRQWRSRTKRCLKESTEFSIRCMKGVRYYHRRDFNLEKVKKVVDEHLRLLKESPWSLAKNAPEVSVSILKDGGRSVCVKHLRNLNLWQPLKDQLRRPKGLRSWVGSNGLRVRDIPSLTPLALVETRSWWGLRESFFLMESSETGKEMDRYILESLNNLEEKRLFIRAFARWLSCLHRKEIFHQDMKTCNILISENGREWKFYLLDQEDIGLDEKVGSGKLFKSFFQLNTSTPRIITTTDRFRFFKEYTRFNPIVNNEKVFLRGLIDKSKKRGIVYVSTQGVVEEKLY